jgi:hypothetical protein
MLIKIHKVKIVSIAIPFVKRCLLENKQLTMGMVGEIK